MMGKWILFLVLFLVHSIDGYSQRDFRVMFYNVENLFDTKDNPATFDDDFLPEGNQRWNDYRYWKKLHDISKVITMVGEGNPPAIVGLCEVENDSVLSDLTRRASLARHKYNYVISQSTDPRGMNVALLYQRDDMQLLNKKEYFPSFDSRSILHVVGKIVNGDTLDVFVCHFHSRIGGIKQTRPYRIESAAILKQKTDSLVGVRKRPHIVIMGDFNDYPDDISLSEVLAAKSLNDSIQNDSLYNLFRYRIEGKKIPQIKQGSYKYRGKWNYLDQIIVNGILLSPSSRTRIKTSQAYVYAADFLLEEDTKGGMKPFRTYSGFRYLGGYSDHLPIYLDLILER